MDDTTPHVHGWVMRCHTHECMSHVIRQTNHLLRTVSLSGLLGVRRHAHTCMTWLRTYMNTWMSHEMSHTHTKMSHQCTSVTYGPLHIYIYPTVRSLCMRYTDLHTHTHRWVMSSMDFLVASHLRLSRLLVVYAQLRWHRDTQTHRHKDT